MGDKTGIQWTDATWNPIAGCSILSPACTNCYAMAQAARIQRMADGAGKSTHYAGTTKEVNGKAVWTGKIVEAPAHIFNAPLNWKRPRKIFVNSMSDIFHENVPERTIDRVFAIMSLCERRHTFQPLTKRPDRAMMYLSARGRLTAWMHAATSMGHAAALVGRTGYPLPHVWIGVTVEDQPRADERREPMRALAAMGWRIFVSYEPALGPVDWTGWEFVSQIIVGGESGPDARPMHPAWVRATLAFCRAHGIAFFFKQWGEWEPREEWSGHLGGGRFEPQLAIMPDGSLCPEDVTPQDVGAHRMARVGKKRAGRLLDGKEYSEFPEAR